MARRKRFESAATARAFRGPGQGLQASRGEIEKKTRADVENIKVAKYQAKEASELLIGGIADAAKFEEGVQKVKNDLEQKVRTRKYEALSKRAETDVDRLLGEAREKEKYAKHWAQLAPKAAKAAGELAGGMFKMHKHLEAQGLIRDRDKKGGFNVFDEGQDDARTSTYEDWLRDRNKVDSTENWNTYFHSIRGKDSQAAANIIKKELYKKTDKEIISWAEELSRQRSWKMTDVSVISILEAVGLSHLNHVGIDAGSRGGREILRRYEQIGILEQQRLTNVKNSKTTRSNMLDTVDDVGAELISPYANRNKMEQVHLNTLVTHVLKGVHDDGKGGFIRYHNLADAGEEALGFYMNKEFSRFQSKADAGDFIDKFILIDPDNPDAKSEGFGLRHEERKERILDKWQDGVDGKAADDATDIKATDQGFKSGFDTRLKEHYKNQKDNPEYTTSTQQFYLNEVEQATRQVGGTNESKNYIFEKALISNEARTEPQKWIAIKQLQLDGKYDEAAALFSGYSTDVREKLASQFKFLDSIKKGGFTHTVGKTTYNGTAAIRAEAQAIHLQTETSDGYGNKNIHGTGTKSVNTMVGRVIAAYNKNIADGMSHEKARINAWEQEKIEYKKGVNQKDRNLYPEEDNAYARRLGSYEHIEKGTMPQWIYKNQQPTSDAENLARIIEYRKASEDGSMAKAVADLKNLELEKMPVESVYLLTRHGYITEEHFLTDPRFVVPKKKNELGTVALDMAAGKTFLDDAQLSAIMPENAKIYAALTNQTPEAVVNKLLEDWNGADKQVRFQAGGQDAAILSNDGDWVNKNNVPGMNAFQACRAQGCTPMRESVQIWLNNFTLVPTDTDREFTTTDGTTVTLPDDGFPSAEPRMQFDPKVEAFSQSLGITYDGVTLSDPETFWQKGGASYLNWDQLNSMFGLQNIENYKEVTKEISEKWKKQK